MKKWAWSSAVNDKEYSMMPGIRRSDLWWIKKSPLHFKFHMEHPEESPALLFGSAAHKMILESDTFDAEYAVMPEVDRRTKAGKAEIEAFKEMHPFQTHIDAESFRTILQMRDALMQNSDVCEILEGNKRVEVPFTWIDGETGENCKCKADILTELYGIPYIVDYKTTTSCDDGAFESACRKYGYRFQAGFYAEGIDLCTLEEHQFAFIVQEKTPPYASRVYFCDKGFVKQGRREFHTLLTKYHECKKSNDWKGYSTEYLYAEEF